MQRDSYAQMQASKPKRNIHPNGRGTPNLLGWRPKKRKWIIHPNGWAMHRRKGGQSDRYAAAKAVNSARARSLDELKLLECNTLCASMWQALHSARRLQGLKANSRISTGRPAALSIGRIWCTSVAIVVLPDCSQSSQRGWADR